jgi:hypothetical protein
MNCLHREKDYGTEDEEVGKDPQEQRQTAVKAGSSFEAEVEGGKQRGGGCDHIVRDDQVIA